MSAPDATWRGLRGAKVVLGVTGGIAAYKAADLASKLVQAGAIVNVVMTEAATQFVQPMTFTALTHRAVYTDIFDGWSEESRGHVTLAAEADLVVIAPATANTIARLAHGLVDDMLAAVCLATSAPIVVAPAMEHHMWHHPATVANIATLRERGVTIVDPESGYLASGASGDGRLASTGRILAVLRGVQGRGGPLAGSRVVVTAGGTQEALDPVRYLGNGSTGTMGLALVEAAIDLGADVTAIVGPTVTPGPTTAKIVRIVSAREMATAVNDATGDADVLVMAAAVADFRPREFSDQKIKKTPGQDDLQIDLVRNPDIIAGVKQPGLLKIGFAAETERLEEYAMGKLRGKGLAMIVANDAATTIGSPDSEATLLFPDREPVRLPKMSKEDVARAVLSEVARLLHVAT
ncbi:MAG TPA: bifunctional phosphopantothenoylcysteine decarboxylase/phosphopantothenate--cysteine ligase CoaBC, partial [Thermomicrobiales bacterium]|nr:bifunctional phosphopantothenoylcysteine decarboxylase/phosphopantothenate--cysteine ligase CoaBC [Thermomicrobiales bacterium]